MKDGEPGELRIRLSERDPDQLRSLLDWLRHEEALRGRVRAENAPAAGTEMAAGLLDALVVAAGSGGVGAVLAGALSTWLSHRRSDVEIRITAEDGSSLEVKGKRVDQSALIADVERLLPPREPEG